MAHFPSILVTCRSRNAWCSFWRPCRRTWCAVSMWGTQVWLLWGGVCVTLERRAWLSLLLSLSWEHFSGAESPTTAPCMNYSCRTGSMIWTRSWKADSLLAECPGVILRCLYPQLSVLFVLDTEFCNFKTGSKSERGKKVLLSKTALAPPHPSHKLCCLQWTPGESSPLLLVFG